MVMRYLLDSNAWIHYFKDANGSVANRLRTIDKDDVVLCSVVWAELLHGATKYERRDRRVAMLYKVLGPFEDLAFDLSAASCYADVRDTLERRGEVIGPYDLQIAAIALVHDLTVVMNNGEFRRVDGLRFEDWSVA